MSTHKHSWELCVCGAMLEPEGAAPRADTDTALRTADVLWSALNDRLEPEERIGYGRLFEQMYGWMLDRQGAASSAPQALDVLDWLIAFDWLLAHENHTLHFGRDHGGGAHIRCASPDGGYLRVVIPTRPSEPTETGETDQP